MEMMDTPPLASPTGVSPAIDPAAPPIGLTREGRYEYIYRRASDVFQRHEQWITFFREVLGSDGIVRKMFTTPEELAEFEKTEEYAAIQQMVTKLRERSGDTCENEPTRVITVRLPKSLHESLKSEAHLQKTSMNQLCISKLLQLIDKDFIPAG